MYAILYEYVDHNAYETCKNLVKIGQQYSDFIGWSQVDEYGKKFRNNTLVETDEVCSPCKDNWCRLTLIWELEMIYLNSKKNVL